MSASVQSTGSCQQGQRSAANEKPGHPESFLNNDPEREACRAEAPTSRPPPQSAPCRDCPARPARGHSAVPGSGGSRNVSSCSRRQVRAGERHPPEAHTARREVSVPESSGTHWANSTCARNVQKQTLAAPPSELSILGEAAFHLQGLGLSSQKVHGKHGAVQGTCRQDGPARDSPNRRLRRAHCRAGSPQKLCRQTPGSSPRGRAPRQTPTKGTSSSEARCPQREGREEGAPAAAGGGSLAGPRRDVAARRPSSHAPGVFPKELKRVHTEPAQGRRRSLIHHCRHLERPRRLDTWDSRGPPRQWSIRHPQRRLSGHEQPRGNLRCARPSEGSPSEGAAHCVLPAT